MWLFEDLYFACSLPATHQIILQNDAVEAELEKAKELAEAANAKVQP